MNHPNTTELFHYYGNIEFALDVLNTKRVYCSKSLSFNDPFDGSIPLKIDYDASEFVAAVHRTYQKDGHNWEGIKKILDTHISSDGNLLNETRELIRSTALAYQKENENGGVLCLTEDPLSVLMWSHYANKHQGVCIGLRRSKDNSLGDDDSCSPIIYSDVYPLPSFSQIYKADASLTDDLLYTKAREWSYEKEWRMISEKGDCFTVIPGNICRVILGCKFPDDKVSEVEHICTKENIPLFRAHQVANHFALELKQQ